MRQSAIKTRTQIFRTAANNKRNQFQTENLIYYKDKKNNNPKCISDHKIKQRKNIILYLKI